MNKKELSERDICTKLITPAVKQAGWDEMSQIREEVYFTKGRIIVRGKLVTRGKPIAAICIAPAIMALAFGNKGVNITIGDDTGTASELEKTGAKHSNCAVEHYVVDTGNKIITTPAYMFGTAKPHQIFEGVSGAIKELLQMA